MADEKHHMDEPEEIHRRDLESVSHDEPDDLHFVVHHTALPETAISKVFDGMIVWIGEKVSWLWIALVLVIVTNVTMRYVFGEGRIEFEEIQWHIYAVGFLLGLSYCFQADDHVRVDVLHANFSIRAQAWIELFGILVFLAPFIFIVCYYAWPFFLSSYEIGEVSDAPAGLPYRWAIKGVLLLGFLLLGIAMLSRLSRVTALLFGLPRPLSNPKPQSGS